MIFLFNFFPPSQQYLKVLPTVAGTSFGRPEGLPSVAVRTSSKSFCPSGTLRESASIQILYLKIYIMKLCVYVYTS